MFQVLTLLPFFLPHLPPCPNLARSSPTWQPNWPFWSPGLCSALCESIQKEMCLKLRSDPSVALCSQFKGFEFVYKVAVWLQLLSWLHPGESSHAELHCAVSYCCLFRCPVSRSPLGWVLLSLRTCRHPLYLQVFPASLFLGCLPWIWVTVCIPLPIGDHLCVFLGPSRLCFPKRQRQCLISVALEPSTVLRI